MKILDNGTRNFGSDGSSPEVIELDKSYDVTEITLKDIAAGTAVLRAKSANGDEFETVDNGTIDLSSKRTWLIDGFRLSEIEITIAPATSYTGTIRQW